ncbi:MAG: single-stranded-DNA-specific exonuclease RecJ [Treponema sp.]|jgi:single-stranded-DNA-specific exonuclease|nr:single-stranded-DNA-specific exonuclease RecJ [Treponema sp.]
MDWYKAELAADSVKAFSEKYGCDLLTASILLRRGITPGEEVRYFLEKDLRHLHNPFDLPGMEDAVERILAAKEEGEKVLVFGDRDTDGITGTVLLTHFLRNAGIDANWRLPLNDEPYGLSARAIEEFAADYGTLVITVDCGISNREEIARATELGVGVVVTDHHNPPEVLPDAYALVNPKLPGRYPFKYLSGCAVAYKLVSALRFALASEVYGQAVCLLNLRPSNDAFVIEIAKMKNLAVIDTLTETVVPGMVGISDTRLPSFLSGQQILSWDVPLQQKMLSRIFGNSIDMQMIDIAPEAGKVIPAAAGKSLVRLKELSRIGRYGGAVQGELETLVNLFVSFVQKKEPLGEEDGFDLQLAALGTIADIMPMRNENRIIVRAGLDSLRNRARPGLSELLAKLNLDIRHMSAEDVSWYLTPAINSAGRMGEPEKAVSLLLGEKSDGDLAAEVSAMNDQRKRLVEDICFRAEPEVAKSLDTYSGSMAVFAGENILPGLTGLIASRLASRFNVPAMVVSFIDDAAKGSFRSVRDYDLGFLLEQCADLFIRYGGHDFAAGFSMERENWDAFLKRLRLICGNMELKPANGKTLEIDAEIPLSYLSKFDEGSKPGDKKELYVLKLADRFEPTGEQNRSLLFLSKGLVISDIQLMGKDQLKHVKLTLDTGKHPPRDLRWVGVYWNASDKIPADFDSGDTVDIVYNLNRNWFNGNETPQMIIRDLKRSDSHEKV